MQLRRWRPFHIALALLQYLIGSAVLGFDAEEAIFTPGMQPLDDRGWTVQAHGGQLYQTEDRTYYWIGEGAKPGCLANPPAMHWGCEPQTLEMSDGINLYSSGDLRNWEFRAQIINASKVVDSKCPQGCRLERPKVLYNNGTKKWVVHLHISTPDLGGSNVWSGVGIWTADAITGPYSYIRSFNPNGWNSGDMTTFKDAETGKAYLTRSLGSGLQDHIVTSPLTSNYLDVEDPVWYTARGEGPAVFKAAPDRYFIFFSGQTWWDPNPPNLARGASMSPPNKWFDVVQSPADGPGSNTTFNAQSTFVFPFKCNSGKSFFLWMGDRWNIRGPGGLANASYVWLPLVPRTDGNYVLLNRDRWSPREYCV